MSTIKIAIYLVSSAAALPDEEVERALNRVNEMVIRGYNAGAVRDDKGGLVGGFTVTKEGS